MSLGRDSVAWPRLAASQPGQSLAAWLCVQERGENSISEMTGFEGDSRERPQRLKLDYSRNTKSLSILQQSPLMMAE